MWHSLTGPHASVALGRGSARRYPRDVAPFSAIAAPTAAAYADLAAELPAGLEARLFRPTEETAPSGWETLSSRPIVQMVLDRSALPQRLAAESRIVRLGSGDAADMLLLTDIARPGPFSARTMTLGSYVGVRNGPTRCLLAMAGERFLLRGYVELSAIAVHPEARGRGLGAALTAFLARHALDRGQTPFLHVLPDNPAARLYQRLGFCERARLWVLWQRPVIGGPQ